LLRRRFIFSYTYALLFCGLFTQDAVTMVQNIQDAEEAAKRLTDEAFKKGSADNITCVVIRFHH